MNKNYSTILLSGAILATSVSAQAQLLPAGSTTRWDVIGSSTATVTIDNPNKAANPGIAIGPVDEEEDGFDSQDGFDFQYNHQNLRHTFPDSEGSVAWEVEAENGSISASTQNSNLRLRIQAPVSYAGSTYPVSILARYYSRAFTSVSSNAPSNQEHSASSTMTFDI